MAQKARRLTEVELELMTILWRLGEGTVGDVLGQLRADRALAYTSVSTILRILEKKGVVASRKHGRGHVYAPRIRKQDYESWSVRDLVVRVFEGAPADLVRRLLESESLTSEDRASIRALLRKKASP
jgi:predicted transcriptional regulator